MKNSVQLSTSAATPPTTTIYAEFAGRVREQVTATVHARRGGRQFNVGQSATLTGNETCPALGGLCVEHEDDFGDIIHTGPEAAVTAGDSAGLVPIHLVKWGNDKPYIVYGWDAIELDVAAADEAIAAHRKHYAAFIADRTTLAALTTEPSPAPGHFPWCASGGCSHVYEDGDEMEHNSDWLVLPADIDCSGSSIKVADPRRGFIAAQLGHTEGVTKPDGTLPSPEVLLSYQGESCGLDTAQFDAFIDQVADFHAGLVAMRRQMDAKQAAK